MLAGWILTSAEGQWKFEQVHLLLDPDNLDRSKIQGSEQVTERSQMAGEW